MRKPAMPYARPGCSGPCPHVARTRLSRRRFAAGRSPPCQTMKFCCCRSKCRSAGGALTHLEDHRQAQAEGNAGFAGQAAALAGEVGDDEACGADGRDHLVVDRAVVLGVVQARWLVAAGADCGLGLEAHQLGR